MATRRGFLAGLAALLPAALAARLLPAAKPLSDGVIGQIENFRFVATDWGETSGDRTVVVGLRKMAAGGKTVVEWIEEYEPLQHQPYAATRIVLPPISTEPAYVALRNSRW